MQGCRPNAPKTCEGIMTPSQVCKHQVCDYCSGRFGMVTHRRWGNKFCKRTCKNAYLRENYRTLSDWIIPRFFFAGGACLATALAVAVLTLLSLASAHAAPDEEQPAATVSLEFHSLPWLSAIPSSDCVLRCIRLSVAPAGRPAPPCFRVISRRAETQHA